MGGTGAFVARELRHMLPPTLFFLVAFNLMAVTASLSIDGVGFFTYATATVSALICGKAVLIADRLPFFNRYPHRPLIWNVAWKTMLYVAITLLIRLAELLIRGWLAEPRIGAGAAHAMAEFSLPRFVMIQLWLTALFLVYVTFSELVLLVGRDRMKRVFLGPLEPRDV